MPELKEDLSIFRHSTSHIMALAVKQLFPEVKVAIGPSIETGFYYDFDKPTPFTPDDLARIEDVMNDIIKADFPFVKQEISRKEAIEFFKSKGENYKVEISEEIPDNIVTLYKTGDFIDLCTGPHIKSTGGVKFFKLLSIAGAYWRGNEKNKMLQRIYGTAFFTKEELDNHLYLLEEAKKRDHRKLGRELELFDITDEIGPGLVIWHPRGAVVRNIIEDFWKKEHIKRGYQLIYTPHIARINLWETSGHLNFYKENMYSPINIENQEYILKPMNCPLHIMVYKNKKRSYRELPMRLAELGTVYRYERSGVLHGMLRVRGFTQDDAHIFCTAEQLPSEMIECVKLAKFMMQEFGFKDYDVYLSTRGDASAEASGVGASDAGGKDKKFAGPKENWDKAESTLAKALEELKVDYITDPGEAVFYGPKIDIKIKDVLGRPWQGPTIQFDFNLAERFDIKYVGSDGKEHLAFMVHRAMLGSLERFMGCLIEHYKGAFPLWLASEQVRIMCISDKNLDYAEKARNILEKEDIRVFLDARNEKLNFKIRDAQNQKVPYMVIIGEKEEQQNNISVRHRAEGDLGHLELAAFINKLKNEIIKREIK